MTPEDFARGCVEGAWSSGHRFGVLESTPRRPGRGQSRRSTNRAGRRIEDRRTVLAVFDRLVGDVVAGLRSGSLAPESARVKIEEAGFTQALQISESASEMSEQLASIIRSGHDVWVDCSPPEIVVYLRFWADESHPRIA